ncbi:riboflavin synthase alpha chain [Syncephalis pseudoplumigaleata]|uniref:Riboflavin synthase n=1 Tax=Syncephalis pseudoplumigaleata TaxID=1712513 RepID=A0A4V1J1K9_9FUNG|nr:riboflavin synthase alpha chain [Syncephalis pseudoplumigaleata]|eukprot:RKP25419.1 riboflavin synthase alpha chain [Syncephalis pseudoplumigaleata]
MFTGIVECMGRISDIQSMDTSLSGGNGWTVTVSGAQSILGDCHLGDSIAINGTCLTVTEADKDTFKVGLSPETLRRTNLGELKVGANVNLERALSPHTRFGGHFVQGHVDTTVTVISRVEESNSLWLKLQPADPSVMRYIIPKGFITLDGTSLTVCDVHYPVGKQASATGEDGPWFNVMLIAYTQGHVVLPQRQVGDRINVEVDMLGKYVERVLSSTLADASQPAGHYVDVLVSRLVAEQLTKLNK